MVVSAEPAAATRRGQVLAVVPEEPLQPCAEVFQSRLERRAGTAARRALDHRRRERRGPSAPRYGESRCTSDGRRNRGKQLIRTVTPSSPVRDNDDRAEHAHRPDPNAGEGAPTAPTAPREPTAQPSVGSRRSWRPRRPRARQSPTASRRPAHPEGGSRRAAARPRGAAATRAATRGPRLARDDLLANREVLAEEAPERAEHLAEARGRRPGARWPASRQPDRPWDPPTLRRAARARRRSRRGPGDPRRRPRNAGRSGRDPVRRRAPTPSATCRRSRAHRQAARSPRASIAAERDDPLAGGCGSRRPARRCPRRSQRVPPSSTR